MGQGQFMDSKKYFSKFGRKTATQKSKKLIQRDDKNQIQCFNYNSERYFETFL